jgi:hypothetical protein
MVHDPHVQNLLPKNTANERAAAIQIAKLAQLEVDLMSPLYEGCDPWHTRLSVTLNLLDIKAKFKCNDASLDAQLEYLHKVFLEGNLLPCSIKEAKKIVCPLDLPHIKYHACIKNCIIY